MTGLEYLASLAIAAVVVGFAVAWEAQEEAMRQAFGTLFYALQIGAGICVAAGAWLLAPVSPRVRGYLFNRAYTARHLAKI